jgi:hypothetical protein
MGFVFVLMRLVEVKPFFDFAIVIGAAYIIGNTVSSAIDRIPNKN